MVWKNGVEVTTEGLVYQLSVFATKFADNWVFTLNNVINEPGQHPLLPHTLYIHFNQDKNYLSSYPQHALPGDIIQSIVIEIKKREHNWFRG